MNGKLDDILDECLDRLASGETVAACVRRFPDHENELTPLLRVASATLHVTKSMSHRPEATVRGLNRLRNAAEQRRSIKASRTGWLWRPAWRPWLLKPLAISLGTVVFVTAVAFGSDVASSNSVPGDPMYWVKTTRENIALMVPQSDLNRARRHIRLAKARGDEMSELMARGRIGAAERLSQRMNHHLSQSALFVGVTAPTNYVEMPYRPLVRRDGRNVVDLKVRLERDGRDLRVSFGELLRTMSPDQRRRVLLLRGRSELAYRALIAGLEEGRPPGSRLLWWVKPPMLSDPLHVPSR